MAVTLDTAPIPVPWDKVNGRARKPKYPFGTLAIGASFFVDGGKDEQDRVVWALRAWRKEHKDVRLVWARGWDGIRVWRVDPEATL